MTVRAVSIETQHTKTSWQIVSLSEWMNWTGIRIVVSHTHAHYQTHTDRWHLGSKISSHKLLLRQIKFKCFLFIIISSLCTQKQRRKKSTRIRRKMIHGGQDSIDGRSTNDGSGRRNHLTLKWSIKWRNVICQPKCNLRNDFSLDQVHEILTHQLIFDLFFQPKNHRIFCGLCRFNLRCLFHYNSIQMFLFFPLDCVSSRQCAMTNVVRYFAGSPWVAIRFFSSFCYLFFAPFSVSRNSKMKTAKLRRE